MKEQCGWRITCELEGGEIEIYDVYNSETALWNKQRFREEYEDDGYEVISVDVEPIYIAG